MASRVVLVVALSLCVLGNFGASTATSISMRIPELLRAKETQLSEQSALKIRDEIVSGASISKELCKEAGLLCGNVMHAYPPSDGQATEKLSVLNSSPARTLMEKTRLSQYENLMHFFFRFSKLESNKTVQVPPLTNSEALQSTKFLHPILRSYFEAMSVPQLLRATGYKNASVYAERTLENVGICKQRLPGDVKECLLALDAIVEFATSNLGSKQLELALSSHKHALLQSFEIVKVELLSKSFVTCHSVWFPYALYMCHQPFNSNLYQVSLRDVSNGEVVIIPASCHMDTSQMDPDHVLFKIIKSKPGESELCHWLMSSHIAWYKK